MCCWRIDKVCISKIDIQSETSLVILSCGLDGEMGCNSLRGVFCFSFPCLRGFTVFDSGFFFGELEIALITSGIMLFNKSLPQSLSTKHFTLLCSTLYRFLHPPSSSSFHYRYFLLLLLLQILPNTLYCHSLWIIAAAIPFSEWDNTATIIFIFYVLWI